MQIEHDGQHRVIFTSSDVLIEQMEKYGAEVPFATTIKKNRPLLHTLMNMNGLPSCNTRADYDYIRAQVIPGWEKLWRQLLEGRFVTQGDDLVEDPCAKLFKLGFTVADVEAAIGFTGLTDREVEWRQSQPDRWQLVADEWAEIEGWAAARAAAKMAETVAAKITDIEVESRRRQLANIIWNGHTWFANTWATKTIESCCAVASALGMADDDLIRVPTPLQAGCWLTADLDSSGNEIVATGVTVADMWQLLAALYDRNGKVWGKALVHKATLEAMAAEGATPEEIEMYDIMVGWE